MKQLYQVQIQEEGHWSETTAVIADAPQAAASEHLQRLAEQESEFDTDHRNYTTDQYSGPRWIKLRVRKQGGQWLNYRMSAKLIAVVVDHTHEHQRLPPPDARQQGKRRNRSKCAELNE